MFVLQVGGELALSYQPQGVAGRVFSKKNVIL
jgi:hypothetical protein